MHTEVLRSLGPATMSTVNSQMVQKGSQGSPVVKNLPSNAGDKGLTPGLGTEIPHATGQLSLYTTTKTWYSRKLINKILKHNKMYKSEGFLKSIS